MTLRLRSPKWGREWNIRKVLLYILRVHVFTVRSRKRTFLLFQHYTIEPTALRLNPTYVKVYCIWMNFIFMGLVPFILLISLNVLTLRSLVEEG